MKTKIFLLIVFLISTTITYSQRYGGQIVSEIRNVTTTEHRIITTVLVESEFTNSEASAKERLLIKLKNLMSKDEKIMYEVWYEVLKESTSESFRGVGTATVNDKNTGENRLIRFVVDCGGSSNIKMYEILYDKILSEMKPSEYTKTLAMDLGVHKCSN